MNAAHRTGGKKRGGNFRLDREFPEPVGRINISSGVSSMKRFRERDQLLTDLWELGQVDTLIAIKRGPGRGGIALAAVLQAKKAGRLHSAALLSDVKLGERLWGSTDLPGAVVRTLPSMGRTSSSRERYTLSFVQLRRVTGEQLGPAARVSDLARVAWSDVWEAWDAAGATKNRARAAVSRFLTLFLDDKWHPFRRDVMKRIPLLKENEVVTDLDATQFWALMKRVPEALVPSFVVLAATGIRVGEYLSCTAENLNAKTHTLTVRGKTDKHEAHIHPELWPEVEAAVPCRISRSGRVPTRIQNDPRYKRLYRALVKASDAEGIPRVTPHTLRHLYVQIGVDQLAASRVQVAVGHKTSEMTNRYAKRKDKGEVATVIGNTLRQAR